MPIATCIGCGCDDLHACQDEHGACYWLTVDYDAGRGVCSCCKDHLTRWNNGQRSVLMMVAKIIKEGEAEPHYIERNAIELFPYQLDVKTGDRFSVEWVEMSSDEYEALPQFEHVRLTKRWAAEITAIGDATDAGDVVAAKQHQREASRLEEEVMALGYDVHELFDIVLA